MQQNHTNVAQELLLPKLHREENIRALLNNFIVLK